MTDTNRSATAIAPESMFGELQKNWGWLLALGILFLVLGMIGLGMTVYLTMWGVFLFGILAFIGGILQIAEAFKCKGWNSIMWHVAIGALYILAGIMIVSNPPKASLILTLAIAIILIVVGISRIIVSFQMKGFGNWIWPFLGGLVSVILGAIIWAKWPISGLWVIGLFISIELMVQGWSNIFIALAARSAPKASIEPA